MDELHRRIGKALDEPKPIKEDKRSKKTRKMGSYSSAAIEMACKKLK